MITYPLNNIDYTAEDAELFHCTRTSGIWAEDSFSISVTGADNNVTVGTGIAWISNEEFSGKVTALKTAKVLDMGIADSVYPRIDVIAIQFNTNNNATDVVLKNGTPASNPVRPAIVRNGAVYELYLASVYRPAGATAITASNVTDLRMDETVCGLMADSVTSIDTSAINAQVEALIANLEAEIEGVMDTSGLMFESEWVEDDVIPIAKGGTGANTAKKTRENLRTDARLLWSNPSPSLAFEAQTINIYDNVMPGDDTYPLYLVIFRASTGIIRDITKIVRRGVASDVQWLENLYTSDDIKYHGRQFTISSFTADFGASFTKTISGGMTSVSEGREKLIPVKIYGINTLEE